MGQSESKPAPPPPRVEDTPNFQLQKIEKENQLAIEKEKIENQRKIRSMEIEAQAEERRYLERIATEKTNLEIAKAKEEAEVSKKKLEVEAAKNKGELEFKLKEQEANFKMKEKQLSQQQQLSEREANERAKQNKLEREKVKEEREAKLKMEEMNAKLKKDEWDHEENIEKIKAGVAEKDKELEIEKLKKETKRIEFEAEQKMKKDEIEANMKKVQLEIESETTKKKLEEETKLAKLKEEEKRFRLIILLTALGFFFVLIAILLIYLNSGSLVCYGDACFGYQGYSSKSETIPKNRRLGENGKLLLTGKTTNTQESKTKLTTLMASAFLATSIIFVLFDLTIQDRKMLNHIGNLVSLYIKRAEGMLNNTRTVIADYTEKAKALARRYWNILLQTEAVKNIVERL